MAKSTYAGYTSREPNDFEKSLIDDYFDKEMVKNFDDYRYSVVSASPDEETGDCDTVLVILQLKNEGSFSESGRQRINEVAEGIFNFSSDHVKCFYTTEDEDGEVVKSHKLYTLERFSNNSVVLFYLHRKYLLES